jgi:hypothetical protein
VQESYKDLFVAGRLRTCASFENEEKKLENQKEEEEEAARCFLKTSAFRFVQFYCRSLR